jgi:hypothetical protein
VNVWNAPLCPEVTLNTDGIMVYLDYYADQGDWETDVAIQDASFTVLTDMSASDYLTGHWTWDLPAPGKVPALFITGKYYDVYGASATLLEQWAAQWLWSYDFSADGHNRSGAHRQREQDLHAEGPSGASVHQR